MSDKSLHIEHLDHSTLVGRTQIFTGERVRIGRRPDNDVVFDPQADRAVSSYHCEIIRQGDHVVLRDLGSHNGTFLGDEQISGDRDLVLPADIRLGKNGPLLRIALSAAVAVAPTSQPIGIGEATLERAINTATGHERKRSRQTVRYLVTTIVVVALAIGAAVWRHGSRLDRESADRAAAQDRMHAELESNRQTAAKSAAAAQNAWSDLAKNISGSVFLCVAENPLTHESGIGTAFVVGPRGLLATNAHVAKMLYDMPARAVIQNSTGRAFDIKRLAIHPEYSTPLSPDVALIEIETEGEIITPIPLADWTDLQALDVGTELGTLGYPGELAETYFAQHGKDEAFTGAIATFKTGRIGRMTTFDLDAGVLTTRKVIQHSASLSGGTSGSPMMTINGKVVGLNNAGLDQTVLVSGAGPGSGVSAMRMANPAQIGYAIRVDELRAVMEKPDWKVPVGANTIQNAKTAP